MVRKVKKKLKLMFDYADIEVVQEVDDEAMLEASYNSGECFYQESYKIFNLEEYN